MHKSVGASIQVISHSRTFALAFTEIMLGFAHWNETHVSVKDVIENIGARKGWSFEWN